MDLGDPLDILGFPQSIELVKQNGAWFGFITNTNNGAGITLLSFGSSLTNTPTAQNLGGYGTTGRIWDTKVVKQGSDFILVFAERNSNNLVRVNFRNSFSNSTVGFVLYDNACWTQCNQWFGCSLDRIDMESASSIQWDKMKSTSLILETIC